MNIPRMTDEQINAVCAQVNYTYNPTKFALALLAARDAQWQASLAEQEPVAGSAAWDNSEGWESLAWELCADENGEESCNELIWEGGPVPEPWGERWLKYEDEAKRLIKLVHKHVPAPSTPAAQRPLTADEHAVMRMAQLSSGVLVHPGKLVDEPSTPTAQERMLADFPALSAFHEKYALGPMTAPSCLCCGQLSASVAIRHAELPGIVICTKCRDAALASKPVAPAVGTEKEITDLIQQRDHRDEIIDQLCDAVLGPDRTEWSSAYYFEDAVNEVNERMAWIEQRLENRDSNALLSATPPAPAQPIDMLLYCPNCGKQHVDKPEGQFYPGFTAEESWELNKAHLLWDNPPHRSHMCHGCGCVWRPADVPTNGVETIKTEGKADTWPVPHNEEVIAALAQPSPEPSKPEQAEAPSDAQLREMFTKDSGGPNPYYRCNQCGETEPGLPEYLAAHWRKHNATLPPASAAGERGVFEEAEKQIQHLLEELTVQRVVDGSARYEVVRSLMASNCIAAMERLLPRLRAALATKPQAEQEATPPAQTVQDSEQLPPQYMLAKLQMVMPLFQEARDALTAITEAQRKLHGISSTLADRMDDAGTFSLDDWNAARTRGDEVGK